MLRFWWNFIFICKIGRETRFCQYFCTYFLIFIEKIVIFCWKKMIFSDMDMFTQFQFEAIISELSFFKTNSVLKSWECFQQNNGSWFFKLIPDFLTKIWPKKSECIYMYIHIYIFWNQMHHKSPSDKIPRRQKLRWQKPLSIEAQDDKSPRDKSPWRQKPQREKLQA